MRLPEAAVRFIAAILLLESAACGGDKGSQPETAPRKAEFRPALRPSGAATRATGDLEATLANGAATDRILVDEALRLGLDRRPRIREAVTAYRDRLLIDAVLEQEALAGVTLNREDFAAFHAAHRDEFVRPRQIRALHFLYPVTEGEAGADRETAKAKAAKLAARLQGRLDIALQTAKEWRDADPAGRYWGDLGYFRRGRFPPEVDDVLFALERPGQTAVLDLPDGIHLFILADVREGHEFSLDEVEDAVRRKALRAAQDAATDEYIKILVDRAGQHAEMVRLEGGEFWMGSTPAEIDRTWNTALKFVGKIKTPLRIWYEDEDHRQVRIRPFYIDRTEVTRGDDDLPMVDVTWEEAVEYCASQGKRLPTVEEWEFAARGVEGRFYPWGDEEPDGTRGNYADQRTDRPWRDEDHDDGYAGLAPVGRYPAGATPEGILDLGGNAREWTSTARLGIFDPKDRRIYDWEDRHGLPGCADLPPITMMHVKSGSFESAADDMHAADIRMLPPDARMPSLGFRCARDGE